MRSRSRILVVATLACVIALGATAAESPAGHSAFEIVSSGNDPEVTQFAGATYDGLRVFGRTWDRSAPTDTDTRTDIYEYSGGATSHVSIGPAGGNGPYGSTYEGASADGAEPPTVVRLPNRTGMGHHRATTEEGFIKSGGGTGPSKPRQPTDATSARCQIRAGASCEIRELPPETLVPIRSSESVPLAPPRVEA